MLWWNVVKLALKSLGAAKMRSFLTMLGVVIGVAAVLAMLAIGEGARVQVTESVRQWGTNVLTVRAGARGSRGVRTETLEELTVEDARALLQEVPEVAAVTPDVAGSAQVKRGDRNTRTTIRGVADTYFEIRNYPLRVGLPFDGTDERHLARVAVLGARISSGPPPPTRWGRRSRSGGRPSRCWASSGSGATRAGPTRTTRSSSLTPPR